MKHMSLGHELPFALLNVELWRCWRRRCGYYYVGHFVDRDKGDGFCCRPTCETDSSYYRGDLCYAGYTTKCFEVLGGGVFPDVIHCVQSNFRIDGLSFCGVNTSLVLRVLT